MCNKFKSFINGVVLSWMLLCTTEAIALNGKLYGYNEMANSLVSKVCQDRHGYIWIATDFGLSKFDGYRFANYYRTQEATSLSSNLVRSMLCTRDGRMLAGTGKGLSRYDYSTDTFHNYIFPEGVTPRVNSLVELPSGDVAAATAGYGLYLLKGDTLEAKPEYSKMARNEYFSNLFVDGNTLWCQTNDHRLVCFIIEKGTPKSVKSYEIDKTALVASFKMADGNLLFVLDNAVWKYDIRRKTMNKNAYGLPAGTKVTSACLAHNGTIYLSTITGTFHVIRPENGTVTSEPLYDGHYILSDFIITHIFEDRDQNLWMCSPRHGLYFSSMKPQQFGTVDFSVLDRRISHGFSSIAPDGNDGLYCVARYRGLLHVDNNERVTECKGLAPEPSTIMRDSKGHYWLGTWKAFYRYEPERGECHLVDDLGGRGTPYLSEDRQGNIYVSVLGEGFAVYDQASKRMTYYNSRNQSGATGVKFDNDWVGMMYCDHDGMMWITTSSGVWCFDPERRHFLDLGGGDGILRDKLCCSICETPDNDIVVGTESGLYLYNRKTHTTELMPGTESIAYMKICGLVPDHLGNLWISTMKGIWQYRYAEKQLVSHFGGSGIADNEFCDGAWASIGSKYIVFGSNSNITYINPRKINNVFDEKAQIYMSRFSTIAKNYDPFGSDFSVAWDDNHFTMSFTLFNYQDNSNITFEYRINDGEWTDFETGSNSLTFTKLKPGTYNIEVRAVSGGEFSPATKLVKVTVGAPWYATTTAKLLYALTGLLVIFFAVMMIYRRQREAFEEEKMRLLINATHDIRSPLTMILGPIAKIKELVGKSCDSDTRNSIDHYMDIVDRNAERLMLLVNQILDMRKIDKNQMRLKCRETDIFAFIKQVCLSFEFTAEQRGIELKVNCDQPKAMAWVDRDNFDKVITNLLSNSFKFTLDGGGISIDITHDDSHIRIRVVDNGPGLGKEKLSRLFERFYQGNDSLGQNSVGTGIGLNLAYSIVKLHGGTIEAANRTDGEHGASFTITLPVGNTHLRPEFIYAEPEKTERGRKAIYKKYRIAVVDDDSDLSAFVASELAPWYFVDTYSNGIDALAGILTHDYDVVVSDVMMPGMDGVEMLKKIKQNPTVNHIPVILLSTKSEAEDRLVGFKSGADAYLAKPFNIDELHARVDTMIDNVNRLRGKYSGSLQQQDKVENIEVKGYDDQLMKKVMKSINAHISDSDFSVDTLSQDVGMSRVQLHRKMKEITGVPVGKFIRNIRMEQAARLILERKINITQVAYSVGFSDQTYFSTVFKQYFGMTPTDYAKKDEMQQQ